MEAEAEAEAEAEEEEHIEGLGCEGSRSSLDQVT
jgi:hypothetical protein